MKPSELFCFKDTKNFAALLFFLVACNKTISVGKCNRYHIGWKWSTRRFVEDGMSMGLTNTHTAHGFSDLYHVFARKQCILCPALRHGCLTLLYVTSIRDFFCPWNNRAKKYFKGTECQEHFCFNSILCLSHYAPWPRSSKNVTL